MDRITQSFKCIVCNEHLNNPVELACRHIGCKRCIMGLYECTLCSEKIVTIGWKTRGDITNIYKIWTKLVAALEKERDVIPVKNSAVTKSSAHTRNSELPAPACRAQQNSKPLEHRFGLDPENGFPEDTSETHFEESEVFGNPCTPTEPYPFDTQVLPGEVEQSPAIRRTPFTQKMPLIDTQVFAPWDTQVETQNGGSASPAKSEDEQRLTQSQPLDLTVGEAEDDFLRDAPFVSRRPAFLLGKPLDLTIRRKDMGNETTTSTTVGIPALQSSWQQEQVIADDFDTTDSEILSATPIPAPTLRPERPVPLTPISQKLAPIGFTPNRSLPVPVAVAESPNNQNSNKNASRASNTTPISKVRSLPGRTSPTQGRQRQLQVRNSIMQSTPEETRRADPDTQFGDGDDQLLLDAEDCLNLVNGNKRPFGDDEAESSDDELFPSSIPTTKRQKINVAANISSVGGMKKREYKNMQNQKENIGTPKGKNTSSTLTSQSKTEKNTEADNRPLEITAETESEDQFAPSWTPPPEDLLQIEEVPLPPAPKYTFCPTRLYPEQLKKLNELCKLCNGEIKKDFSDTVTHLLLNLDKDGISFTFKYLQAIAGKKWVLSFAWVEECVKQGRMVPEEPFETSNFPGSDPGVRISRLSSTNVFEGFNFYVPFDIKSSSVTAEDCKQLLTALGGEILQELPETKERLLIVGDPAEFSLSYKQLHAEHGWITISWDWILDCVLGYKLIPFSSENILTPGLDGVFLSQVSVPRPLLTL